MEQGERGLDCYSLGIAAVEQMQIHNAQMANELPRALKTLFADDEFREAMAGAGVAPDAEHQQGSYEHHRQPAQERAYRHITPSPPRTRQKAKASTIDPLRATLNEIDASRAPIPPLQTISTRSVTSKWVGDAALAATRPTFVADSSNSNSSQGFRLVAPDEFQPHTLRLVTFGQNSGDVPSPVISVSLPDSETSLVRSSSPSQKVRVQGDCLENDEILVKQSISQVGAVFIGSAVGEDESQCVSCGKQVDKDGVELDITTAEGRDHLKLQYFFWISIGLKKKLYEHANDKIPFCNDCLSKVKRLMSICQQVSNLEEEFDQCRDSLVNTMAERFAPMTLAAKNGNSSRVQIVVSRELKAAYDAIRPGKVLWGQASLLAETALKSNSEGNTDEDSLSEIMSGVEGSSDDESAAQKTVQAKKRRLLKRDKKTVVTGENEDASGPRSSMLRYGYNESELREVLKSAKTDNDDYECPKCSKRLANSYHLKCHLELHKKKEMGPFKCQFCGNSFPTSEENELHELTHTEKKRFDCDFCDHSFRTLKLKQGHEKRHVNCKFVSCSICKKTLSKETIQSHMETHKPKRLACPHCPKSFSTPQYLRGHMTRHKGFRPIKCSLCSQTFLRRRTLPAHFLKCHPGEAIASNIEITKH